MVDRTIFSEEFGLTVACVMGMGKSEVDQERILILARFALGQVVEDLRCVPATAFLVACASFDSIPDNGEFFIRCGVAVSPLACAHGVVASSIENSTHGVVAQVFRNELLIFLVRITTVLRLVRNMPEGPAGHDHVAGRGADPAAPSTHLIGSIHNKSSGSQGIDRWGRKRRLWIVDLQVERGLVICENEEDVRAFSSRNNGCLDEHDAQDSKKGCFDHRVANYATDSPVYSFTTLSSPQQRRTQEVFFLRDIVIAEDVLTPSSSAGCMKSIKPGRGPSAMAAVGGVFAVIFGIFWIVMASSITSGMGGVGFIFPLFGVFFVIMAIGGVVYNAKNATSENRFSTFDITSESEESDPLNELFGQEKKDATPSSDLTFDKPEEETVRERLAKLEALRKDGLITEQEYEAQRGIIISSL